MLLGLSRKVLYTNSTPRTTTLLIVWLGCWWNSISGTATAQLPDFAPIQAILQEQCVDCHNPKAFEGALDLQQFASSESALLQRATWKRLFDAVEAGRMPLPESGYTLDSDQRQHLLHFATVLQSQPDPQLGVLDPGKPVLRRLTRLEYNNTVRDLFGLKIDIFMFPERLPVADKRYFLDGREGLGQVVETSMREYGQKYDVLLPQSGLPGDNRAEYGFANRGDTLNFSPLLFEKYLDMAAAIAGSERLFRDSLVMQDLLGVAPTKPIDNAPQPAAPNSVSASSRFAEPQHIGSKALENDTGHNVFVSLLTNAFEHGSGGVFDVPASLNNQTIAGKGGLLKLNVGSQVLTINPNADLWLAAFATADETSGEHLLTNRVKGQKQFELTFDFEGDEKPAIEHLAVCVLARKKQSGRVSLSAVLNDGQQMRRSAEISEQSGNVFFSWVAPPRTSIKKLAINGSDFSGDYVLLDDLGFILNGVPQSLPTQELPEKDDVLQQPLSNGAASLVDDSRQPRPVQPLADRVEYFLTRAYRRSVKPQELQQALRLVEEQASQNGSTALEDSPTNSPTVAALRKLVQSVLSSPDFLFVAEPVTATEEKVRRLDDFELASRLSYFLWSSLPDEELLDLAIRGELSRPEVLRQQTERMLKDRVRSRELSESFAAQWLRLDQLYTSKPDRQLFKEFYSGPQGKSTLHGPMMTEALLLFETVLAENRSIMDLLDPDFTWLNSQLAELYKLEASFEAACQQAAHDGWLPGEIAAKDSSKYWVRTPLTDRNRGGVMTMAGPLVLTSLPQRTSPVKRGAWLLETIFNRPPSEPKVAFVLEEPAKVSEVEQATQSVRQRFEKHRSDPNCYSCHVRIDPPGFSLEVFDAIGADRTHDGTQPVDASGTWNGRSFTNPAGFKEAARVNEREVVRGFVEHLMSYALGRRIEYFDMPAVDRIIEQAAADDNRFTTIIQGVVDSYPFQNVRNTE